MTSSFDVLAAEYYDSELHPTCSALRAASLAAIAEYLMAEPLEATGHGLALEVGAGRSAWLDSSQLRRAYPQTRVIASDISNAMLAHSGDEMGMSRVVAKASTLPFRDQTFELIVGVLFDPYNDIPFLRDAYRCLEEEGRILITCPSWEWAHTFRHNGTKNEAEFLVRSGDLVRVRSRILESNVQISEMELAQFRNICTVGVTSSELPIVPPKLAVVGEGTPVVVAFIGRR